MRGNQVKAGICRRKHLVTVGSIPARAGEPLQWAFRGPCSCLRSIPARAGEPAPIIFGTLSEWAGSIPARAGEPVNRGIRPSFRPQGLSPRVRGNLRRRAERAERGLSPRVRGHRLSPFATRRVYPRACGGTGDRSAPGAQSLCGLSPRVRGNRPPGLDPRRPMPPWVYPRACGGTQLKIRHRL